jgi:hypothetical protein
MAAPAEMTARVNTAERREHIGIVFPPWDRRTLEHDPEKWKPVFRQDDAQKKNLGGDPIG